MSFIKAVVGKLLADAKAYLVANRQALTIGVLVGLILGLVL